MGPSYVPTGLTLRQRRLATLFLALGNFMVVLDMSICNVSIPHISGDLGISLDQGAWVITSYAVAEAICIPLTGWLAGRFGAVRVFVMSMAGFGLFSLLCGVAPNLVLLVAFRILQGLCGAPLLPSSQALLARIYPPEERAGAMAIWSMTTASAPAVGPLLGGVITDNLNWHWIFLINVPIAVVSCLATLALLSRIEIPGVRRAIDTVGLGLLVFWVGCLQIMLDIGNDRDWFGDGQIVCLAIGALVGFCLFVVWELTEEHPVVDLRIFRHRGFAVAVVTGSLIYASYFAGVVAIPQWLQAVQGYSATQAGVVAGMTAVSASLASPIASRLTGRLDLRVMVTGALIWLSLWSWVRTGWSIDTDVVTLCVPQLIQGIAMPMYLVPLTLTTVNSVEPGETASATGIYAFVRTISIAITTSLALAFWSQRQRMVGVDMASSLDPAVVHDTLSGSPLAADQHAPLLAHLLDLQARTVGLENLFLLAGLMQVAGAMLIWLGPKVRLPQAR